jgi:uncharacterized DUF497 family protein
VSYFVLRQGLHPKVDWSHRREHVAEKGLTVEQANEALEDPEMLVIDPDPRSVTGDSVRIIGYSSTAQEVLTVVVVIHDGQALPRGGRTSTSVVFIGEVSGYDETKSEGRCRGHHRR